MREGRAPSNLDETFRSKYHGVNSDEHVRTVHGYRRAFRMAGSGPALLLIHGIGDSNRTWDTVFPALAKTHTVIAPDLLGHGQSDKPRADYSLGGFANAMRDLLVLLDVERVTVVGHSLGGGVALQFAYQYPQLCERIVLVSSGGLGAEVSPLLRLAALPGAGAAITAAVLPPVRWPVLTVFRAAAQLGLLDRHEVREAGRVLHGLRDASTRKAFLRTLRSVVDVRGQAVSSRDRLYLTAPIPMMLVWGTHDHILPVAHAHTAVEDLPGCHLQVVPQAGHLPHQTDPAGFVAAVEEFVNSTTPVPHDARLWRTLLEGTAPGSDTISLDT